MHTSHPSRRHFLHTSAATATALALPSLAQAQAFPAKPIRLICP